MYQFIVDNEIIYIGSTNNLYNRIKEHNSCIQKGLNAKSKSAFYDFLANNQFTIQFQLTDNYRQLEQQLIEKYNPKYNCLKAYTGISWNGNEIEYYKDYYQKFKEEKKQYDNQQCNYNGENITLCALKMRFRRKGVSNPTAEAKKYLIK